MAKKLFGIFIWVNDEPMTGNVLNLTNIVEPRKALNEYREGERVTAKCPSYGHQIGVIGKIADESGKKCLDEILNGAGFNDLVAKHFTSDVSCETSRQTATESSKAAVTKSKPAPKKTKQNGIESSKAAVTKSKPAPKIVKKTAPKQGKSLKRPHEADVQGLTEEDIQQRDAHVRSIWAVTVPTLPMQVTKPTSTVPIAVPATSVRTEASDQGSDSEMSSDSELEELIMTPRAIVRNCMSCVTHLKLISELQQEVAALKRQAMVGSSQGEHHDLNRPKAGMVPPEVAKEFGMLETYPQSGVFWYRGQKDAVHFNSKEPEQMISKMVDVFFDKETQQQSSARGSGKYAALNQSIVDACLRFVQRLYEVDESVLIKVINDKCSHQRRPRRLGLYSKEKYVARKQQLKEKKEARERKQKKREEKKKLLESA